MTNMPGDMAKTSVTDFLTLTKLGRVSESTMFEPDHASKVVGSWPTDRMEIDAYDNGHGPIWPILYVRK